MKQLPFLWLLLVPGPTGIAAKDASGDSEEAQQRRRLEQLGRRLEVIEHEPELLDERGHTPLLQLGGLKLRHVLTVNRNQPWQIGHAKFSEEYHERRRLRESDAQEERLRLGSRRLSSIQTDHLREVAATPFVFTIPRDRVRVFAALNAAALPEAAWTNASLNFWQAGGKVHPNPGAMLYTNNRTSINDTSLTGSGWTDNHTGGWTVKSMGNNFSGDADTIGNAYRDGQALRGARKSIRDEANKQTPGWKQDTYAGMRLNLLGCTSTESTEPRCWTDPGVALSVYEETGNTVIVFHSDWSINWYEYTLWHHRAWIIDNVETQVKNQWTIDSRQVVTPEMMDNKGTQYDENQERCAFKEQPNQPFNDVDAFSRDQLLDDNALRTEGYWSLVKRILRTVLPETRDMVAEKDISIYLTGSGFGGTWAALSSMYLKKVDDAKYETFLIAASGFECFARRLTSDMNPWEDHDQIKIYAHIMDIYARMDFVSGYLCLYGFYNMTEGSDIHSFCRGIVGFTGPQLLYRGEPVGLYEECRLSTEESCQAVQKDKVDEARKLFDACHYYTHSPWYAAMLFLDWNVLMRDGTTDGGCAAVQSIPQDDQLGRCPTAARVDDDCKAIEEVEVPFPWEACIIVASGMVVFFCCIGLLLQMFLKLIDNKMWVFAQDDRAGKSLGAIILHLFLSVVCICRKHKKQKKKKRNGCKAQAARERAMQAKMAKFQRSQQAKGDKKKKKTEVDKAESKGTKAWQAMKGKLNVIAHMNEDQTDILQAAAVVGRTEAPGQCPVISNLQTDAQARSEEAVPLQDAHMQQFQEVDEEEARRERRARKKEDRKKDRDKRKMNREDRDNERERREKDRSRERRRDRKDSSPESGGSRERSQDRGERKPDNTVFEPPNRAMAEKDMPAEAVLLRARAGSDSTPRLASSGTTGLGSSRRSLAGDAEMKIPLTEAMSNDQSESNLTLPTESNTASFESAAASTQGSAPLAPGLGAPSPGSGLLAPDAAKSKEKKRIGRPSSRRASSHDAHAPGQQASPRPAGTRRASSHGAHPRAPADDAAGQEASPRPAAPRRPSASSTRSAREGRKPRGERKEERSAGLAHNTQNSSDSNRKDAAATKIQAVHRGSQARKRVQAGKSASARPDKGERGERKRPGKAQSHPAPSSNQPSVPGADPDAAAATNTSKDSDVL